MIKYLAISFLLVLSLSGIKVYSQNIEFEKENFPDKKNELKEIKATITEGDKYYDLGGGYFKNALKFYEKAYNFNPSNALLNYKIAKCELNSYEKTKAIFYLNKTLKLDSGIISDIYFLLGQAYQYKMKWDSAITIYNKYLRKALPLELAANKKEAEKRIEECKYGKELTEHSTKIFIDNLSKDINSQYDDYGVVINADESALMFTSRRANCTGGKIDPKLNVYYEDIFICKNGNGKWLKPENPGEPLNTEFHDATVGLSVDGQKLLIYKSDNDGDIFECKLTGDKWGQPYILNDNINTKYHESSASLSYDGKTLYFVSDKPGGYGGRDIYMSKLNDKGIWGEAVILGPTINTAYDEESVFIHPDGKTLYFSSKGHKTMGDYDIFYSVYENGLWSEPVNLGYPINSPYDDVFFVLSASAQHGYFASNRENGFGDMDLYKMTYFKEKNLANKSEENGSDSSKLASEYSFELKNKLYLIKGEVLDETTKQPIPATIEVVDNEKNEVIASFEANSQTGKYLVSLPSGKNYGMAIKADNYLIESENFNIPSDADYTEVMKHFTMKKVEVGKKVVLNNIFFDFDMSILKKESISELERIIEFLNKMPKVKIEISGHADNVGSDGYNQRLSEERAKAVVEYLEKRGINKDRLSFIGYGRKQPQASNDTEEGRKLNRRTEFKVTAK
ncbi:MAG: OmpA family protein [Bacteroidales bacterium]|jgi:outer membrane protein OmpA-like peptidoglycan-associated protein